eukprot:4476459-Pleurochrysis_carterae.AAC.1
MPTLSLRFFVYSMDSEGHIYWPARSTDTGRKLLRKLARRKVKVILDDPEFPTCPSMARALTVAGGET